MSGIWQPYPPVKYPHVPMGEHQAPNGQHNKPLLGNMKTPSSSTKSLLGSSNPCYVRHLKGPDRESDNNNWCIINWFLAGRSSINSWYIITIVGFNNNNVLIRGI